MLISGGGLKTLTSLYNSIGGSRKTTSSAYANINGSRKQIFPYSATTIYTWNRYYTETEYSTRYHLWTNYEEYYPYDDKLANYGGNLYYGTNYSISGSVIKLTGVKTVNRSGGSWSIPSGSYYWLEKGSGTFGCIQSMDMSTYEYDQVTLWYGDIMDEYLDMYIFQRIEEEETVKGELRDQVTSSSRNTYPDNGVSGSYWYVFVS